MISVVAGEQFWRRRICFLSPQNQKYRIGGCSYIALRTCSTAGQKVQPDRRIPFLTLLFYMVRDNVVVPAMSCAKASMKNTAPWRVQRATRASWTAHSKRNPQPLLTGDRSKVMTTSGKDSTCLQSARTPYILILLIFYKTRSTDISAPSLSLPFPATLQK